MRKLVETFEVVLSGKIRLAAKDIDGSVLAVNIETPDGELYLVDDTKKGNDLLMYLGAEVTVKGLTRFEDGFNIIEIEEYLVGVTHRIGLKNKWSDLRGPKS